MKNFGIWNYIEFLFYFNQKFTKRTKGLFLDKRYRIHTYVRKRLIFSICSKNHRVLDIR